MDEYNGLPHQPEQLPALPEDNEEQQTPRRPGAELYEWLQMFLGCVVAAVVLFNCVARLTRVDGGSMDTTLQHGEIMLIWSLGYTPKQGDIVVLNKTSVLLPDWTDPRAIVKRVIATGGQTVDVDYSTGAVYVDGRPLDEPYLHEEMRRPGPPPCRRPTGRFPRAPSSSWETTGTTPPTAGTACWAPLTPIISWARPSLPFGLWTASAPYKHPAPAGMSRSGLCGQRNYPLM